MEKWAQRDHSPHLPPPHPPHPHPPPLEHLCAKVCHQALCRLCVFLRPTTITDSSYFEVYNMTKHR